MRVPAGIRDEARSRHCANSAGSSFQDGRQSWRSPRRAIIEIATTRVYGAKTIDSGLPRLYSRAAFAAASDGFDPLSVLGLLVVRPLSGKRLRAADHQDRTRRRSVEFKRREKRTDVREPDVRCNGVARSPLRARVGQRSPLHSD